MLRTVRVFLPVAGDSRRLEQAFSGDPSKWLPDARRVGSGQFRIDVFAGSLSRGVTVTIGEPWRVGATQWRALNWDPVPEDGDSAAVDRLLPALDAEVGLCRCRADETTIVLDGRYAPPGGPIGAAVDAVALHRVARSTAERFLAAVATRLSSEAVLLEQP